MRTLQQQQQHSHIGIGSQSALNISSDMMLANINSQLTIPVQPQNMGDADTTDIRNLDDGHLQIGEIDSNANNNFNDKENNSDKSRTDLGKNNKDSDSDNGDNVEIRYKQKSPNEIEKSIIDTVAKDHDKRERISDSNEGLSYHD